MIQTNISMSPELHTKLKEYAFKQGISISAVIREALEEKLGTITMKHVDINLPENIEIKKGVPKIDPFFLDDPSKYEDSNPAPISTNIVSTSENLEARGKCQNCGQMKVLTEREVVYELERKKMRICDTCWKQAQRSGNT